MNDTIQKFIDGLEVGGPATAGGLSVFPVFNRGSEGAAYRLFTEVAAQGLVAVEEKGEGGSVPELVLVNKSDYNVLITDGDELIGGKQNRIVNVTMLVAPMTVVQLPVSCVEAGRWRRVTQRFAAGEKAFFRLRHELHRQVKDSMRFEGQRRSDQSRVWETVREELRAADATSPTGAMNDAYQQKRDHLDALARAAYVDGAFGLVGAIDGRVAFAEVFARPDPAARAWNRIVRSLAFGATVEAAGPDVTPQAAREFLVAAASATVESFPSPGAGEDLRLSGEGVEGSALVTGDGVVHCVLFADQPVL